MKHLFFYVCVLAVILSTPLGTVRADTNPSISSFIVQPTVISNGQPINITWTLVNAGGHLLLLSCPTGVTARYLNGQSFPCNTRTSISTNPSDATTLLISNNSGTTNQVNVSIIPKDPASSEYNAAMQTLSFTVATNPEPVTTFTVATSTPSGTATTLSWTAASDVPAANLIVGCTTSDISFTAPSLGSGSLPCGVVMSANGLSANGSIGLVFTNKSLNDITVPLTLVPAIVFGSYDATHGKQSAINVLPVKNVDMSIISFTASPAQVLSGDTGTLSWTTQNPSGVNLKFSCNQNVSVAKVISGVTTTVACSTYLFDQPLKTTSATVMLTNSSYSNQTITAGLIPANSDNTYNGMLEKDITLTVFGMGVTTTPPVIAPPATTTIATTAAVPAPQTPAASTAKKFIFAKPLSRRGSGADVRELQKFFAKYPSTYGTVTVNGLFGPATEKLVMRFQEKYGIAKKGQAGYGTVGPATRKKLNELQ